MGTVFVLKLSEMKKSIKFRGLNLNDEIWIQETFKDYDSKMTVENIDMGIVSEILFRVLKTREYFASREVKRINDSGKLENYEVGGLELFRQNIISTEDTSGILDAFVTILGKSRPEVVTPKKKAIMKKSIFTLFSIVFALGIAGAIARQWDYL